MTVRTDATGNVLICKSATPGCEDRPGVILQSHMDMVCEKNAGVEHDFDKDPIDVYIDGEWVKARGTTLGADNGIGMAAALAVLASDDLVHPSLEALFTVDEETGLTGAFGMEEGFISGKYLLNLDSEDVPAVSIRLLHLHIRLILSPPGMWHYVFLYRNCKADIRVAI